MIADGVSGRVKFYVISYAHSISDVHMSFLTDISRRDVKVGEANKDLFMRQSNMLFIVPCQVWRTFLDH